MEQFFNHLETVAEQKTRLAKESAEAKRQAIAEEIKRRAAAPIIGRGVDTTGDLFDLNESSAPLFAIKPQTKKQ